MSNSVVFPEDRNGLQTWIFNAGEASADAVLIHPPRPSRDGQQIMVLKGSMLQNYETSSCSKTAVEIRKHLLKIGTIVVAETGSYFLAEDVIFGNRYSSGKLRPRRKQRWTAVLETRQRGAKSQIGCGDGESRQARTSLL
jgi:hypothetical protein